jgi:hypothetical protein
MNLADAIPKESYREYSYKLSEVRVLIKLLDANKTPSDSRFEILSEFEVEELTRTRDRLVTELEAFKNYFEGKD